MSWYRMKRGWTEHPVFGREAYCRRSAFVWLVENACYQASRVPGPRGIIELQRGQLSHSTRFLADAWNWDEKRVRRFLAALAAEEMIIADTAAGQTLISICNYEKYQGSDCGAAADDGAAAPQSRRGGAAKSKEGKEIKKEEGGSGARARATPTREYAFEGAHIRLTARDYDRWLATFSAIPDLRAELTSLDAWLSDQLEEKQKKWFIIVSQSLNRKHQEIMQWRQSNDAPAPPTKTFTTADYYRQLDAEGGIRRSDYN